MHFPLDCWAFRWWYWAFRLFKKICLKEVERGQERGLPHNDFLSKCSQSRLGQTKAKSQETPFRCPMWEAGSQVIELSSAASLRAHQQEPGLETEMAHDHRQSDLECEHSKLRLNILHNTHLLSISSIPLGYQCFFFFMKCLFRCLSLFSHP